MLVFEFKEGRLNLWWEMFRLWEMFRKEIRSNEELMITLSICTVAFGVGTDVSNKWYRKNSVVQVIARKVGNTLRETYCLRSVLFSEPTVFHTDSLCPQVEPLVTLQNRRNFSRFSRGQTDARGECKGQVARAGKKK